MGEELRLLLTSGDINQQVRRRLQEKLSVNSFYERQKTVLMRPLSREPQTQSEEAEFVVV